VPSFDEPKFAQFIASLELKNFNYKELLVGRYQPLNTPPPERLWHNIVPTVIVLDRLRDKFGAGIQLISGYRSEDYNDPVKSGNSGRAPGSTHQAFSALDFKVTGKKPEEVKAQLRKWETNEWFYSPVWFNRVTERLSTGKKIQMGVLPQQIDLGAIGGCYFQYRGYIKAYGVKFTHFDTRGITSSTPAQTGGFDYDEEAE
jgi:hypothetical protein